MPVAIIFRFWFERFPWRSSIPDACSIYRFLLSSGCISDILKWIPACAIIHGLVCLTCSDWAKTFSMYANTIWSHIFSSCDKWSRSFTWLKVESRRGNGLDSLITNNMVWFLQWNYYFDFRYSCAFLITAVANSVHATVARSNMWCKLRSEGYKPHTTWLYTNFYRSFPMGNASFCPIVLLKMIYFVYALFTFFTMLVIVV